MWNAEICCSYFSVYRRKFKLVGHFQDIWAALGGQAGSATGISLIVLRNWGHERDFGLRNPSTRNATSEKRTTSATREQITRTKVKGRHGNGKSNGQLLSDHFSFSKKKKENNGGKRKKGRWKKIDGIEWRNATGNGAEEPRIFSHFPTDVEIISEFKNIPCGNDCVFGYCALKPSISA